MTIALAKAVHDFLQDQVRSGVCADARELVHDVIGSRAETAENDALEKLWQS